MARRRRQSTRLLELKNAARRAGWLKWLRDGAGEEADERALLAGCRFSVRRGEHFVRFVDETATLSEGPWKGHKFELLDWQRAFAMRLFGWIRPSPEWGSWVRRFRYAYLEVPKKNGKTPFIATIGNYLMFADCARRQINVHLAATTRKQAERCLIHAIRQIQKHPGLARAGKITKFEGFYQVAAGDNRWTVLAADPESADGVNGHCLADELHRWKGFEFFNSLRWMLASQPEGLFVGITTAGNDFQSVCRTLHEKTKLIDAGRQVDESFLGVIYAADKTDDPHREATWRAANPSLGSDRNSPLKLSTFRQDYESAKKDPTQWPTWLQLRLNVWRSAEDSWIDDFGGIAAWDAGPTARAQHKQRIDCYEPFALEDLEGEDCYAAFDGATVRDTSALVLAFPGKGDLVRVLPRFWLPRAQAEREQARVPYRHWADEGHLTLTDGDAVDFRRVLQDLIELFARVRVLRFYFDPLFQAEWLTQELAAATGVERVEFPQTITHFAAPTQACERLIVERNLRHNGHPVLAWQLGHTHVRTDVNQNKRPVKPKKGDYRTIDGVVALIMSLRDIVAGEDPSYDFYTDHDVEFI